MSTPTPTVRDASRDERIARTLDRKCRIAGKLAHNRADLAEYRADRSAAMRGELSR